MSEQTAKSSTPAKRPSPDKVFVVSNTALSKALKKIKDVIPRNAIIPILENVRVEVNGNKLSLRASDLDITLDVNIELAEPSEDQFSALLPFDMLMGISSLSGDVNLKVITNDKGSSIKAPHDIYELSTEDDVEQFPKLPEFPNGEFPHDVYLGKGFGNWFIKALETTNTSKDNLHPAMGRVCVDIKDSEAVIASTDGMRLFKIAVPCSGSKTGRILLSHKVIRTISDLSDITISWNDEHLKIDGGDITLYTTMMAEKFPLYQSIIKHAAPNIEFNRLSLISAVQKALLTCNAANLVEFHLKRLIGIVKIESADTGLSRKSSVDIAADYLGDCDKVLFSGTFLISLLNQVPFENVSFAIKNESTPVLISSEEDTSYVGMTMPYKFQSDITPIQN